MTKKTLTERTISYLKSFCTELHSPSRKYRLFKVNHDIVRYYHVGKSGAIRTSTTGNSTDSISVSDYMKARTIAWEKNIESNKD